MEKISESKVLYWLSLPMFSVRKQTELIKFYGSAAALWENFTSDSERIKDFVGDRVFSELSRYHDKSYINKSLDMLRADNISVITVLNPLFPKLLLEPEVGAPLVLYYRGDIEVFSTTCVAVVGTRAATVYGKEMAKLVAGELAENGVTVVSGLATGIDAYAHAAALDVGGKTIAVLGSGLNKVTPVGNQKLFDRIIENGGLVMSEYKPNIDANKFTFPERNRLISGLGRGVAVIEAGEKSGALITAGFALEQNREVFAVPGNITSTRSKGCNDLLFNGANFIRSGLDILEYLSIKPTKINENAEIIVDKEQKKLYSLLSDGEKTIDELVQLSGLNVDDLSVQLLEMELSGAIVRQSANVYALKNGK